MVRVAASDWIPVAGVSRLNRKTVDLAQLCQVDDDLRAFGDMIVQVEEVVRPGELYAVKREQGMRYFSTHC